MDVIATMLAGLLLMAFGIALIPLMIALNGWIMTTVWNWFMPIIFGLPHLGILQGLAIMLVVSFFKSSYQMPKGDKSDKIAHGVTEFLRPFVTLAMAYIIKSLMGI